MTITNAQCVSMHAEINRRQVERVTLTWKAEATDEMRAVLAMDTPVGYLSRAAGEERIADVVFHPRDDHAPWSRRALVKMAVVPGADETEVHVRARVEYASDQDLDAALATYRGVGILEIADAQGEMDLDGEGQGDE